MLLERYFGTDERLPGNGGTGGELSAPGCATCSRKKNS
jgi:hypothetical protein